MQRDPNIGQPPSAGGGEAPAQGGGRGLPAPQAARAFVIKVARIAVWFGVRMLFVAVLFLSIGLLGHMSMEPLETELQELIAFALFAVLAACGVFLFWCTIKLVTDSVAAFRQGLREGRK